MRQLLNLLRKNPFDALLKRVSSEQKNRFLVVWNRGLGDIPLGLYALVHRIRTYIPSASITFITRKDLAEACATLEGAQVLIGKNWERGKPIDLRATLKELLLSPTLFDVILEKPDPTKWLKWQLGTLTPKLRWEEKRDALIDRYGLDKSATYIGCHVDTETGAYYGYEKNWDLPSWRNLFKRIAEEKRGKVILFGMKKEPAFLMDNLIDLRGETNFSEMVALIKNRTRYLVAPDSGILSTIYYIDAHYPIRLVSLWADPKQGILRQKVDSPNAQLEHLPLHGKNNRLSNISVDQVYNALFQ